MILNAYNLQNNICIDGDIEERFKSKNWYRSPENKLERNCDTSL